MIVALVGFLTVADDFRHIGELLGVLGVLFSGVALLAAGSRHRVLRLFSMPWLALGIAAGAGLGAVLDNMPAGVASGSMVGLVAAFLLGRSRLDRPAAGGTEVQ